MAGFTKYKGKKPNKASWAASAHQQGFRQTISEHVNVRKKCTSLHSRVIQHTIQQNVQIKKQAEW